MSGVFSWTCQHVAASEADLFFTIYKKSEEAALLIAKLQLARKLQALVHLLGLIRDFIPLLVQVPQHFCIAEFAGANAEDHDSLHTSL